MKPDPSLTDFSSFCRTKKPAVGKALKEHKTAVIYTRVSTKEQADKNLSLDFQLKAIVEFASRNGFTIVERFGGTYESAKTDGRKEFDRMLSYARKSKGTVSHILVYTLDRFSRTGGGAIQLAKELMESHGVAILAVTQPSDTHTASGEFQQSIQFLFSYQDNLLRKQRAIAGTREKLLRGQWCGKPPMGYDRITKSGTSKIVVNAVGKKLLKAFEWKAAGMKSEEVLLKIQKMGVPMYKQKLWLIFNNPFYCGVITHKALGTQIVEGVHEALVSKALFFKVNEIPENASGRGVSHLKERDEVPLKVFIKCSECQQPFTGYEVKLKKLWYYKCRTQGCRFNKSARQIHELFHHLLQSYCLRPNLVAPLKALLGSVFQMKAKGQKEEADFFKKQLLEITQKLEKLEERFWVTGDMPKEVFEKYAGQLKVEQLEITQEIAKSEESISNPAEAIEKAVQIASELPNLWASYQVGQKEKLQKLLFPDGIIYNRQTGSFRTPKVNAVFATIAGLERLLSKNKTGQKHQKVSLSSYVGTTRFELATP